MEFLKADFHIHTFEDPYDVIEWDAKKIIDEAQRLNYKVLAITNHHSIYHNAYLKEYAAERGILLIPGCEAQICNKHVVILNPGPKTLDCRNFDDLRKEKRKGRPMAVVAPHPFFPSSVALGKLLFRYADVFDAIEWGSYYFKRFNFNVFAARAAQQLGKPLVGNSDAHFSRQFGQTYTIVDAQPDVEAVVESIIGGRCRVVTRPLKFEGFVIGIAARGFGVPERFDAFNRNVSYS